MTRGKCRRCGRPAPSNSSAYMVIYDKVPCDDGSGGEGVKRTSIAKAVLCHWCGAELAEACKRFVGGRP